MSVFKDICFTLGLQPTGKMSERMTPWNMPARNTLTLVQLLALYTDPESQNAVSQTDRRTDRQTDDRIIAVGLRSANSSITVSFRQPRTFDRSQYTVY